MKALNVSPTPDAMYAVRDALDHSTVRLALPTIRATGCYSRLRTTRRSRRSSGPPAMEVSSPTARTSGRVQWNETASRAAADCALAFDPPRTWWRSGSGIERATLVNPATGAATGTSSPSALRTAGSGAAGPAPSVTVSEIYVNPAGTQMAVVTSTTGSPAGDQIELWNLQTKTGLLVQPTAQIVDASFTADGSELLAGTEDRHVAPDQHRRRRRRPGRDGRRGRRPGHARGQPDGRHGGRR